MAMRSALLSSRRGHLRVLGGGRFAGRIRHAPQVAAAATARLIYPRLFELQAVQNTGTETGRMKSRLTGHKCPLSVCRCWNTSDAVSIVDNQAPAVERADSTYPYDEHFLFANCLIDGHHRVQAAAELGTPVRLLVIVATKYSLVARKDEFAAVLEPFMR
jgi:hypothetical protein